MIHGNIQGHIIEASTMMEFIERLRQIEYNIYGKGTQDLTIAELNKSNGTYSVDCISDKDHEFDFLK